MSTGHSNVVVPRITRTFHKKVRTGCVTCKARRVRCDEKKPACDRCISSGRTCDGYPPPAPWKKKRKGPQTSVDSESTYDCWPVSSTSSRPSTPSTSTLLSTICELKLALPRNNHMEVRSFRFFLEITAPSLSGVFDSDFWNGDIPRTCHADSAIWHAVVCLSAVHESYASSTLPCTTILPRNSIDKSEFALRQFNLSIRHLLNAAPRGEDKWRALAASILFTCICSIRDLHEEARVHLSAGRNLLSELDEEHTKSHPRGSRQKSYSSSYAVAPVSLDSLRSIVINLDMYARAVTNGPLRYKAGSIPASDHFTVWRYYQPPLRAEESLNMVSASDPGRWQYATSENLTKANRAAESLFNGILLFQAESVDLIAALVTRDGFGITEDLIKRQEPYWRCFSNLTTALRVFHNEAGDQLARVGPSDDSHKLDLARAYLTLKFYHSSTRLFLFGDPEMPEIRLEPARMGAYYTDILDAVERVLQLGGPRSAPSVPVPSTTQPLSIVALSGIPQSNRRRAVELLRRYPRREGLWDTTFAASLTDLIMAREKEIIAERRARERAASAAAVATSDANDVGNVVEEEVEKDESDDDMIVEVLDRQYGTRVSFESERRAQVSLSTWREWIHGQPGKTCWLEW